jgi:hypothetical protein
LRLLRFLFLTSMFKERNFPFSGCKGTKKIELVKFSTNFFFQPTRRFTTPGLFFEERPHRLGGQMYNRFSNLKILLENFFSGLSKNDRPVSHSLF